MGFYNNIRLELIKWNLTSIPFYLYDENTDEYVLSDLPSSFIFPELKSGDYKICLTCLNNFIQDFKKYGELKSCYVYVERVFQGNKRKIKKVIDYDLKNSTPITRIKENFIDLI